MFKYFNIFKTVYETMNFSKAAEQLFISQSTVSQQIKLLEEELGVELFIRQGKRKIFPTLAAEKYYQDGIRIWENIEHLKETIKNNNDKIECKIAVSNTIAETIIADIFEYINHQKYFNNLNISIEMTNSTRISEGMKNHHYDFGFVEKPITTQEIHRVPFFSDELVFAGNLEDSLWLEREEGSGVRHFTEEFWKLQNIKPKNVVTIQNNELILQFLKKGIGKTVISKSILEDKIPYQKINNNFIRNFYFLSQNSYSYNELNQLKNDIEYFIKKEH
ncbi:LysR family transcriptional regulator [Lactobacillus sp. S2-2]|uniref:LysR family transcriptional regulator n=1 Tax=Lactobacillus sp. S2-2 TaxID=2692917 RepID=UPI001F24E6F6|nr:LysR family transcriptional regulator [Lactobacillus sp. S2-2]MCF6514725.1 LysR family transcriptional regulator [Lactobacillus sp. S2-2]